MRKIILILFVEIFFLFSNVCTLICYEKEVKNLSSVIAEDIIDSKVKTIAVVDFTDLQGNVTELGRFIAEEFSVALAGDKKGFEVIDRTHLKSILKEHKLSITGLIDPTTARKLGEITGVSALVTGTITSFGDSVRLSVKILDTTTAKIVGVATGNIPKTKAIEELLSREIMGIEISTTSSASVFAGKTKTVEVEGFAFKPVKCQRKGGALICTVSFQNMGSDERTLRVNDYHTYFYDNYGNKYSVSVCIGKEKPRDTIEEKFIPQLPVNVDFITEDIVPSEATNITLAIGINGFKKAVIIRNIPITK